MKIRIMGTEKECREVEKMYRELEKSDNSLVISISTLYPNRGSDKVYRMYIDISHE